MHIFKKCWYYFPSQVVIHLSTQSRIERKTELFEKEHVQNKLYYFKTRSMFKIACHIFSRQIKKKKLFYQKFQSGLKTARELICSNSDLVGVLGRSLLI